MFLEFQGHLGIFAIEASDHLGIHGPLGGLREGFRVIQAFELKRSDHLGIHGPLGGLREGFREAF